MKPDFPLTSPVQLGAYRLRNPIVITSNPRLQASEHLPQPEAISYYANKSSCGLIITEATLVSPSDILSNYPGIYTRQQLHLWRNITENVKKRKGKIFLQLYYGDKTQQKNNVDIINSFRRAAQNALAAEFDGIEISFDFGCISTKIPTCDRQLETKTQLLLSIAEEVASIWDENKVGIKLTSESELFKLGEYSLTRHFYYLLDAINFYKIAFLHLTDLITGDFAQTELALNWLNLIHAIYSGTLIIDCQNTHKNIREIIAKKSTDMISVNNISRLLI